MDLRDLVDREITRDEYSRAEKLRSSKFGAVTSGRSIKKGSEEFNSIKKSIGKAKKTDKTIAVYRKIFKDKVVKIGASREEILKDFMESTFMAEPNGMLVGGYLTVEGRSKAEDFTFIENIKRIWEN